MKIIKFIVCLLLFIILMNSTAFAFGKKFTRGLIFNNVPFTRETAGNYTNSFKVGERIYWLYMSNKPIKADFIGIQVVSATHKTGWGTITGIVHTHDYRINRDSPYYFTDYVVIHSPGHYYMQVFDKNDLHRPLTRADFFVK